MISIIIAIVSLGCKNLDKHMMAQKDADYIINNLDKKFVIERFPSQNFQDKQTLENILTGIREHCEWKHRNGKFVDFCRIKNLNGGDATAYIYEFYMKCDSIRFILFYDMDKKEPELYHFNIEPIEFENKLILFPEKQLKNQN